ncbi:GH36 C-terminal domain-containing protein [Streptomyces sp. NPDC102462]|uniref:GH36 C-terminal domain-containing protein n=1 Tax=Streptomyces sp. NPDC102462 TaxID=3366178 RepID=UPI00380431F8
MASYKAVRHLMQHGRQYRLAAPLGECPTIVQYLAEDADELLILTYRHSPRYGSPLLPVRLCGLPPGARYRNAESGTVHHSTVLTEYGLHLDLPTGDWASAAVHLVRIQNDK